MPEITKFLGSGEKSSLEIKSKILEPAQLISAFNKDQRRWKIVFMAFC